MDDRAPRPAGRGPASRPGRAPATSAVLTPPTGLPAARSTPPGEAAGAPPRVPPRPPAAAPPVVDPCVCRHAREAHEHWRRGSDCGVCGPRRCARYRRRGGALRRFLRRLRLVR
jgi:hypothetical protein